MLGALLEYWGTTRFCWTYWDQKTPPLPAVLSVEEAVRAYTAGSAFAEFQENDKGTITPGKVADLVILSRDIFQIDPKEIEKTKVVMTIMDGRVVYEAK